MKSMLVVAFSAVLLAVVAAKSCTDSADCDDGQCCAGFMPFRGTCKAMTTEGKKCLINKAIFPFNEIYIVACPCEEGLECTKVEGGKKSKNDGVCQPPPTTEPETTEPEEVTTQAEEVTTEAEVVTKDGSGEVTKDGSGEVTKDEVVTEEEVTTEEDKEVVTEEDKEVVTEEDKEEVTEEDKEVVTEEDKEVVTEEDKKDESTEEETKEE